MPFSATAEAFDKDLKIVLDEDLSPAAQSQALAEAAREALTEAVAQNTAALGHAPLHDTIVDGRTTERDVLNGGTTEFSVRPDGTIVYEFHLVADVFAYIDEQLRKHSPVGQGSDPHPGLYRASHAFFADGQAADPLNAPPAREYVFVNTQPYARKIERGVSSQAPDGVYQAVAALAAGRFGNIARIAYDFRSVQGARVRGRRSELPNPAIVITLR